ncbi:hypothetical protein [Agarilytica rhodophyticola]|uniref:hypothetical protein n=1 Tax=Agarilytica rhodophyticola TaxID=1737490 RepID=UPI000B3469EB|nr:hypothetical protein [Agarilytica rhodophyticola]
MISYKEHIDLAAKKRERLIAEMSEIEYILIGYASGKIKNYLCCNSVAGYKYSFDSAKFNNDQLIFEMSRIGEYPIDEDFDSDEGFDSFLGELATKLQLRRVAVPYRYHPK